MTERNRRQRMAAKSPKYYEKRRRRAAHKSLLAMREMNAAFREMWHWEALRDRARRS